MERNLSYEYILYFNHSDQGYDFYDQSQSFPTAYRRELQDICVRIEEPKSTVGNTVALRYSPLRDRYLWSVIFRQPGGDGQQNRGVTTVVNLLMTAEQADRAFREKPDRLLWNIEAEARALLKKLNIPVVAGAQQAVSAQSKIPAVQLLNAASYVSRASLSKQAYFVTEMPILPEVAAMLEVLPPKLRKTVSFHTGIQSTRESIGIAVSFCTPMMMEDAIRSNLSGGQNNTNKYLYYFYTSGECDSRQADTSGIRESRQLLNALQQPLYPEQFNPLMLEYIESWKQLEALAAQDTPEDALDLLLETVPNDALTLFLQTNKLPNDTLIMLKKRAKANRIPIFEIDPSSSIPLPPQPNNGFSYPQEKQAESLSGPAMRLPEGRRRGRRSSKEERQETRAPRPAVNLNLPLLHRALWAGIKLAALAVLIWCAALLLKSLVQISSIPQEQTVTIVIGLNTVKSFWKILGLTGITAAVSSIITYHVTKWNRRKKRKENKENQ